MPKSQLIAVRIEENALQFIIQLIDLISLFANIIYSHYFHQHLPLLSHTALICPVRYTHAETQTENDDDFLRWSDSDDNDFDEGIYIS